MLRKLTLPLVFYVILASTLGKRLLREKFPPQSVGEENGDAKLENILCPSGVPGYLFTECLDVLQIRSEPHPRRPGWDRLAE